MIVSLITNGPVKFQDLPVDEVLIELSVIKLFARKIHLRCRMCMVDPGINSALESARHNLRLLRQRPRVAVT